MQLRKLLLSSLTNRCKCNWLWACPKFLFNFFSFELPLTHFRRVPHVVCVFCDYVIHPISHLCVCVCVCGLYLKFLQQILSYFAGISQMRKKTHQRWPRPGEARHSRGGEYGILNGFACVHISLLCFALPFVCFRF